MSVDDGAKTFTVKFNGAPPGDYYFAVSTSSTSAYGRLSTSLISFKTSSTVTGFSPLGGSVLGGSVITITGTNFSTDKTEMAVKVGDQYCIIESINQSGTEIVCRIEQTGYAVTDAGNVDLLVFLAAFWEA